MRKTTAKASKGKNKKREIKGLYRDYIREGKKEANAP